MDVGLTQTDFSIIWKHKRNFNFHFQVKLMEKIWAVAVPFYNNFLGISKSLQMSCHKIFFDRKPIVPPRRKSSKNTKKPTVSIYQAIKKTFYMKIYFWNWKIDFYSRKWLSITIKLFVCGSNFYFKNRKKSVG